MQYLPCNSALLAQETLFLTKKGTVFAQRSPKSAQIATNLNLRQNSVCSGSKFLSQSKLFGEGSLCPRATSATRSQPKKSIAVFSSKLVFVVNYEQFSTDITKSHLSLSQNMRQNLVKDLHQRVSQFDIKSHPPTSVQYTFQLNKIFYILSCSYLYI